MGGTEWGVVREWGMFSCMYKECGTRDVGLCIQSIGVLCIYSVAGCGMYVYVYILCVCVYVHLCGVICMWCAHTCAHVCVCAVKRH